MLTQEKPKAYSNIGYASYFLWRGAAIILSKEVMQCLLFDFMEDDLRQSFNDAAHFSGLHSPEEESLSSLLHASEYILDEADAMKASMPTYNKLFDMCSFALLEGRSIPLDFDALENARNAMEADAPEAEAAGVVQSAGPEAAGVVESAGPEAEGVQSSSPLSSLSQLSSEDPEEGVEERVEDVEGPPAKRLRSRGS